MGRLGLRLLSVFGRPRHGAEMAAVPGGRVRLADGRRAWVRGFLLDLRPVTNADYRRFMESTGAPRPEWMTRSGFDAPEQPVVGVSLADARAFARWARKRLPSRLEWLRAARGDDARPYPWGDAWPQPAHAHFARGARGRPAAVTGVVERPAGAAPFGHRDLAGNVWEWCAEGALCGGFWGSPDVRLDATLSEPPTRRSAGIGFRCAF